MISQQFRPISLSDFTFLRGFWADRIGINRDVTLAIASERMQQTGRFESLRQQWKEGMSQKPHFFWDSDIAKWLEAVAYAISAKPDAALRAKAEEIIERLAAGQHPDGYINTYYSVVEPGNRWTNLRDMHELYCAGHLMEAAVAWFHATGERQFLNIMERYAMHIGAIFGAEPNKKHGYSGHEEIELALIKLADATGNTVLRDLAAYFVHQRGQAPHYFAEESGKEDSPETRRAYTYHQAHKPVLEQNTAEGHAVRAGYLYAGMVDVAMATHDTDLMQTCKKIWRNLIDRRIYITGGIGSSHLGERLTVDYDLPNEEAYAETCAAISLVLFAHRMLHAELDAEYADVMERALYNGIASGVSLTGDRFFYANPLSQQHALRTYRKEMEGGGWVTERQPWFDVSCCPPNVARLYASLGTYAASISDDTIAIHLYAEASLHASIAGAECTLHMTTAYPWDGKISIACELSQATTCTLALRIPGWCRAGAELIINEECLPLNEITRKGYAHIHRTWRTGDKVMLVLPMEPVFMSAHPSVSANAERVAIQRGPIVYCLESCDHDVDIRHLSVMTESELTIHPCPDILGGCVRIEGSALLREPSLRKEHDSAPVEKFVPSCKQSCCDSQNTPLMKGYDEALYAPYTSPTRQTTFRAVPYALWNNRTAGDMLVWLPKA